MPKPERATRAALLYDELVVDNFAGGGGATLGIEQALGRAVDVAINHDSEAIGLHMANHPHTRHYCESVWKIDPEEVTCGRPVGLAWFSPDCKDFSLAKGSKPVSKRVRALAWVVVRWARRVKPRVIMLENVREFEGWGPLIPKTDEDGLVVTGEDGKPLWVRCPKRKGQTFKKFVRQLRAEGYKVEWRRLDAADFGAPTHRRRLFMIARNDGVPIRWPEPTHGPGRAFCWRAAAECIDWSLPCPSIFLTREQARPLGVKRPLAVKTQRRIAMGLKRYVIDNPYPFIVPVNHGGDHFRGSPVSEPLGTVTGSHGEALVAPFCTAQFGERPGQAPRSHDVTAPMPTITPRDGGGFPLVTAHLTKFFGGVVGSEATEPAPTVTTIDHNGLVAAHIARIGQAGGNGAYVNGAGEPLGTVVSKAEHCAVAANLVRMNHGDKQWHSAEEPAPAVVTANHHGLVASHLMRYNGEKPGDTDRGLDAGGPLGVVTAEPRFALVAAFLSKFFGTSTGSLFDKPAPSVTAGGNHAAPTFAFMTKYHGCEREVGSAADEPLRTQGVKECFGLVRVHGQRYAIVDVGLRMLTPRELFRCQGFPESYVIDRDHAGRRYSKSVQVKLCGNSVPPPEVRALVAANFPEEAPCPDSGSGSRSSRTAAGRGTSRRARSRSASPATATRTTRATSTRPGLLDQASGPTA